MSKRKQTKSRDTIEEDIADLARFANVPDGFARIAGRRLAPIARKFRAFWKNSWGSASVAASIFLSLGAVGLLAIGSLPGEKQRTFDQIVIDQAFAPANFESMKEFKPLTIVLAKELGELPDSLKGLSLVTIIVQRDRTTGHNPNIICLKWTTYWAFGRIENPLSNIDVGGHGETRDRKCWPMLRGSKKDL